MTSFQFLAGTRACFLVFASRLALRCTHSWAPFCTVHLSFPDGEVTWTCG